MQYSYIKEAGYIDSYKFRCLFEDGKEGILDLTEYMSRGGVFEKIKNEDYAKKISLVDGILTWGNGELDIAPETVYHIVTKSPLPKWMEGND